MDLIQTFSQLLWQPWLLGLFLAAGGLLSLCCGFFPLVALPQWLGAILCGLRVPAGSRQGISPLRALATALASTIGTGSIAGVAAAIYLGGPGAVFWMWLSALLGLSTSFVEKFLAVRYHTPAPKGLWQGGPMFYLRDGLGAPLLAGWFAAACLPATLTGGNLIQASSIADALQTALGVSPLCSGLAAALAAALVIAGGIGRISSAAAALVPGMALLYLGGGILVLCRFAGQIPHALALIFSCALSPEAAAAGVGGYTLSAALRHGVARGVFTNEAGLGTSAIAHGASSGTPVQQGFWGMLEVFFSTMLVCSVTALVILVSGVYDPAAALSAIASGALPPGALSAPLTAAAFSAGLGHWGALIVSLSLALFAFTSILGWYYYGLQCLRFLSGARLVPLYTVLFPCCTVLGALLDTGSIWPMVDLCNALMAIPNLTGILLLSPQALADLRRWRRGRLEQI